MWSQWLLTSLSYPSSILLFSLLWFSASENRKYISTDHFAAKVTGATENARPENAGLENDEQHFSKLLSKITGSGKYRTGK